MINQTKQKVLGAKFILTKIWYFLLIDFLTDFFAFLLTLSWMFLYRSKLVRVNNLLFTFLKVMNLWLFLLEMYINNLGKIKLQKYLYIIIKVTLKNIPVSCGRNFCSKLKLYKGWLFSNFSLFMLVSI